MHGAVLELHRQLTRAVVIRPISLVGVIGDVVDEFVPPIQRRLLADLRKVDAVRQGGPLRKSFTLDLPVPAKVRRDGRRVGPAVRTPRLGEGREHLVRVPRAVADGPWPHGIRTTCGDQRHIVGQRLADSLVTGPPERSRLRRDVHGLGSRLADQGWDDLVRRPGAHDDGPLIGGLRRVQCGQ